MFFKYLPVVNFVIATSALIFQTTVLYPWHHEIDRSHHALKEKLDSYLDRTNKVEEKVENLRETV